MPFRALILQGPGGHHEVDRTASDQFAVIPVATGAGFIAAVDLDGRINPCFDLVQQLAGVPFLGRFRG